MENQTNKINEESAEKKQEVAKPIRGDNDQESFDKDIEESKSSVVQSNMKIYEEDDDGLNMVGDFTTSL